MNVKCLNRSLISLSFALSSFSMADSGFVNGDAPAAPSRSGNAVAVQAGELAPLCFQRIYTAAHLAANPKQLVTSIEWIQESALDHDIDQVFQVSMQARQYVRGIHSNLRGTWSNDGSCSVSSPIKVNCKTSFGSVATLHGREGHVTLEIAAGNAFAVAHSDSSSRMVLDGNDADNNVFRLYQVPCANLRFLSPNNIY